VPAPIRSKRHSRSRRAGCWFRGVALVSSGWSSMQSDHCSETHGFYDIDADDLRDLVERLERGSVRAEDQAGPLGTRPEAAPSAVRIAARDGGLTVARSANTPMFPASVRSEPYGVLGTARPSQPRR
jgi:hypothetical protein